MSQHAIAAQQDASLRHADMRRSLADTLGAYKNWGIYQPGGRSEPFIPSGGPPELCGAGNFTQLSMSVAGWSNSQCTNKFIIMCKIRCG